MKKFLLAALLLLAPCVVHAQKAPTPELPSLDTIAKIFGLKPRFVVLDDYVRDKLSAEWDKHAHEQVKLERAFCLGWQYDIWAGEVAYRVTQISDADSVEATVNSVRFVCPQGDRIAEVHIHPDQTCIESRTTGILNCWDGGPYAHQCLPSDADRRYLSWVKQPFGIVQCTREGTVFYFPMGDNR